MKRDSALVLVLALLALLALGVAGATLTDPAASAGDGLFGGAGSSGLDGADDPGVNVSSGERPAGGPSFVGPCLDWLDTLPVRVGLTLLVVGLAVGVARRSETSWLAGGLMFLLGGVLTHLLFSLLTACGPLLPEMQPSSGAPGAEVTPDELGNGSGSGAPGAAESVASDPSLLLGALLVLAIAAAVLLLVFASGDSTAPPPDAEEDEPEPDTDVAAVGRAAGRAADRIDESDDDFENDVYRAWVEMTDHLAVDHPESSTPAEFAAAAVDAGMGADDVRELTTLFEEARYGDYAVTAERETRAVAALRRIEDRYAADGSAVAGDGPGGDDRADRPGAADGTGSDDAGDDGGGARR